MNKPNFFIIGAPKCGTSALHDYLGQHERIFFCEPKEPNYFATDLPTQRYVKTKEEYLRLFDTEQNSYLAAGEASAWYMYSKDAVSNILKYDPEAKIIVMVRNPIEMYPSLHKMLYRNFVESENDIEKAWRLQSTRAGGEGLPENRNKKFDESSLQYQKVCELGNQLERVMSIVPQKQLKVIVFDDFTSKTKEVYEDVLDFLNVPTDGRTEFKAVNVRRDFKNRRLAFLIWKFRDFGASIKRKLGIVKAFNVLEMLNKFNIQKETRPTLRPEFNQELKNTFKADIDKLSKMLDRDLSNWYNK